MVGAGGLGRGYASCVDIYYLSRYCICKYWILDTRYYKDIYLYMYIYIVHILATIYIHIINIYQL